MTARVALVSTIMLMLLAAAPPLPAADHAERPNIIFIMADDMGYGDAGCFGQQVIQTPNLDRLAAEGMRFTQCYAGSTVCAPSRSVLMTGLHTGHTRVRGNFGKGGVRGLGGGSGRVPLRESDVTVAELLQDHGYRTGMTGKWGLGEPKTEGLPTLKGFDAWLGFLNQRRAHTYYPDYIWLGDHEFPLPGNTGGRQQQYVTDLFTGFAMNFIRDAAGEPFFLYLPYTVPHGDYEIPDHGIYEDRNWSHQEKTYAAMISRMDEHIGRIMTLLQDLKIDEQTVVFFCSDNGAANRYEGLFDSSGPLRGGKRDMHEGGLRTPMIVRWPGHVEEGTVSDVAWYFADFLATAADLADIERIPPTDGVSVVPILLGEKDRLPDRFLYWEYFERGYQQAARWQNWKAIRPQRGEPLELYNLEDDLGETNDVAGDHPQIVRRFEEYFAGARTDSEEWPLPEVRRASQSDSK